LNDKSVIKKLSDFRGNNVHIYDIQHILKLIRNTFNGCTGFESELELPVSTKIDEKYLF
jgi:hypothetical protein